MVEVPVLIIGGGPVGLAASLLCSRHGLASMLVERHDGTSRHPKARGLNVRTLELFRTWGIETEVRRGAGALDRALDVLWMTTLTGEEIARAPYGGPLELTHPDSPTTSAACAQDRLEPVLLDAARAFDMAEIRFGHEMTRIAQDRDAVTATVVERRTGRETEVRAAFAVAADGAKSPTRTALDIPAEGPGVLTEMIAIYFKADLAEVGARRPALLYVIAGPGARGTMAAVDLREQWIFMTGFRPANGERIEDFGEARCIDIVRKATGIADLDVELLSVLPWQAAASTATRFRLGRVFLAGDAAHLIPPMGGQAMNVGIQDAHNLVWKLRGVIEGWAGPSLLETYDAERRAVAKYVTEQTVLNMESGGRGERAEQFSNRGIVLGTSYASSAVIADDTELPALANPRVEYVQTARPGSRAPHFWVEMHGKRLSTIDLFDTTFVLLADTAGVWHASADAVSRRLRVPMTRFSVGTDGDLACDPRAWRDLYGVSASGAVLVRPDGFVAWRSVGAVDDPEARLERVLSAILGRP